MNEEIFYTLKGYQLKDRQSLTPAMEDYIEMIYRIGGQKRQVHVKDLSLNLNVKSSSVTKMINRLKEMNLVNFEKYGLVELTADGYIYGKYFLYRHECLTKFFKFLNNESYKLEQVEKIEHFIDVVTIENIEKLMKKLDIIEK